MNGILAILYFAGWAYVLYLICNGILGVTGGTDPQERKAATIAVMTAAVLNSDKTPKTK